MAIFSRNLSRRRRCLLMPSEGSGSGPTRSFFSAETAVAECEPDYCDPDLLEPHRVEPPAEQFQRNSFEAPRSEATPLSPNASQDEVIESLFAALSSFRRDFHDQSSQLLELMIVVADSTSGERREELLDEIGRLRWLVSELDQTTDPAKPSVEAKPVAADRPKASPAQPAVNRTPRERVFPEPAAPSAIAQPAIHSAAKCGQVAQRIARTQRQRASGWKQLFRSVCLLG